MVSQFNNFDDKFQKAMKEISTNSDENFEVVMKAINDRFDAIALGSQHSSLYGLPLPQLFTVKAYASWFEGVFYEFQTLSVRITSISIRKNQNNSFCELIVLLIKLVYCQ